MSDKCNKDRQFLVDIRNFQTKKTITDIQPNKIIVLAARTDISSERVFDYSTNTEGTLNIIRCLKNLNCQDSHLDGTQLVNSLGAVSSEELPLDPKCLRESKAIMEKMISILTKDENYSSVIVRPTTVWGEEFSSHYKSWFNAIRNRYYFHTGLKDVKKSFGYVGNIAYQYLKILNARKLETNGKIFYLADYEAVGLAEFSKIVAHEYGVSEPVRIPLIVCRFLALFGDFINHLGYRFPYTSFSIKTSKHRMFLI